MCNSCIVYRQYCCSAVCLASTDTHPRHLELDTQTLDMPSTPLDTNLSVRLLPTENLWSASRVIRGLGMVVMGSQWCQGVPPTPANAFFCEARPPRARAAPDARISRRTAKSSRIFVNIGKFRRGSRTLH